MTKRRIDNDIESMSDDVLSSLSPEERVQLFIQSVAEDREDWPKWLLETCPRDVYEMTDPEYFELGWRALFMVYDATYQLHTTFLHYKLADHHLKHEIVHGIERLELESEPSDLEPESEHSEEDREKARERADRVKRLYAELFTLYRAYERLAEEVFGLDLLDWLSIHPDGESVVELVREVIDLDWRQKHAERLLNDGHFGDNVDSNDDQRATLDDIAEERAAAMVVAWEDGVADIGA